MKRTVLWFLALPVLIVMISVPIAHGQVLFTFDDRSPLDGTPVGITDSGVPDPVTGANVALTTVEATALAFDSSGMPTGLVFSSAAGDGVETHINTGGNLGVDNLSIGNIFGVNENTSFNPDETLVIEFDQDVVFDFIDFAFLSASETFEISVAGGPAFTFVDDLNNDIFSDPLNGFVVTAGTDVTFQVFGPIETTATGISEFSVSPVAVPEPGSLVLIGCGGLLAIARRRRR